MEIRINLDEKITKPYIVIHTNEINNEIESIINSIKENQSLLSIRYKEKILFVNKKEIEIIRIEDKTTYVYLKDKKCIIDKRLYEMENILGNDFIRISKQAIINTKKINYVEPSFNCTMCVIMKNGQRDYLSRKYLKHFKNRLNI